MTFKKLLAATAVSMALGNVAQAVELTVRITNLTSGFHFTPRLLVAHDAGAPNTPLFTSGQAARAELIEIAEGGNVRWRWQADTPLHNSAFRSLRAEQCVGAGSDRSAVRLMLYRSAAVYGNGT